MTFTKTVKNELTTIPLNHNEMLAEFSAFLNLSCEFHIESGIKMIDFNTTNPTVSKRFLMLSKALYQVETELLTKSQTVFKKKNIVILRLSGQIDKIINEHDYFGNNIEAIKLITKSDDEKIAFLRGALLVSGSINDPKTAEYHLEIFVSDQKLAILVQTLINHFDFNARITKRREGFIVYLKDAETISDFIQLVGAYNALFKYEDIRIKRDLNNSINRLINVELANEKKSLVASNQQIEEIKLIKKYNALNNIDSKILEVMELRLKYPDANLRELTTYFELEYGKTISRSGLSHRFNKVKELANKIKGE